MNLYEVHDLWDSFFPQHIAAQTGHGPIERPNGDIGNLDAIAGVLQGTLKEVVVYFPRYLDFFILQDRAVVFLQGARGSDRCSQVNDR